MEQDLTLTQKISLQEKLLQMSDAKHRNSEMLEGVELSPGDKRRLKNSLERDRKILARSISRERELQQRYKKLRASGKSTVSQESEEYRR